MSVFLAKKIEKFPKLFSAISSAKIAYPAALVLNLLDGLSTWMCLVFSGRMEIEGNPLLGFAFRRFGLGAGLLVGKVFLISILIVLFLRIVSSHTKIAFILFFFFLCVNNFVSLVFIGLS